MQSNVKNCCVSVCHSIPFNKALAASLLCFSFNLSRFVSFSVVGLNFDFLLYNITGFLAYGFFNVGMFWVSEVKVSQGRQALASWVSHLF